MEAKTLHTNAVALRKKPLNFSVARITSGTFIGSGCLLEGGWVLTCAHNLPDYLSISILICDKSGIFNTPISIKREIRIIDECDLALLPIDSELPTHTCPLILADVTMSQNNPCSVYGFPKTNIPDGLVCNQATIDSIDIPSDKGWPQIILSNAKPIYHGFSGSPIIDTRLGLLVGMVLHQNPDGTDQVRGIPAQTIAARLGLPLSERSPYPGLIERINKQFLQSEQGKEGDQLTAEKFYMADGPAQWWGVLNGLVAPKKLYHSLPRRVTDAFYDSAPVLALLDGSGGMGKTTTARLLVVDLCERFECWWVDGLGGEELDEAIPDFLENRAQTGRETLVVLDDWGKYSNDLRHTLGQFMRRQLSRGENTNIRFLITAKPDEHTDLGFDLVPSNAKVQFDDNEHLKTDNENLLKVALAHLEKRLTGLYENLFTPEDRLIGRPFHLLFILLRAANDPELRKSLTQTNAAGKFLQVMQYDFSRLYRDEDRRGLAVAVLFCAYVKHKHGYSLTFEAFLELVEQYSVGKISPGKRLTSQIPEHWNILNHYLTKSKKEGDKRANSPEFIQFKKDEYPEYLLQLNLPDGRTTANFLEDDKKIIVQFLLEHGGNYFPSQLVYIFSHKEHLLTDEEQVATVELLLSRGSTHHSYTSIFLTPDALPLVSFEQKWTWIKRFSILAPNNGPFHTFFVNFIKQAKSESWFEYVSALTSLGADSDSIWLPFLSGAPAEIAIMESKRLLKESKNFQVLCRCLGLLSKEPEVKGEAFRLLKIEGQHPNVISVCLNLLSKEPEVKGEAFRLLKIEGQHPNVISVCLNLLNKETEVKNEVIRLLKIENQHPNVISACLNLLNKEPMAKNEAIRLLKIESQHPIIISFCLNLLRMEPEAKTETIRLLKIEDQHPAIITRCLKMLRKDPVAKTFARKLLVTNHYFQVICSCLDLLGNEAKPQTRELLEVENQHPQIVSRCLLLLDDEAKPKARKLLNAPVQDPIVISHCLDLLGAEVISQAQKLFKVENQHPKVIYSCLKNIKVFDPNWQEAHDFCIDYIKKWQGKNRLALGGCLLFLDSEPSLVRLCCREILENWKAECIKTKKQLAQKIPTSDYYIQKALKHPDLYLLVPKTLDAMYNQEKNQKGFLTPNLKKFVYNSKKKGTRPAWKDQDNSENYDLKQKKDPE